MEEVMDRQQFVQELEVNGFVEYLADYVCKDVLPVWCCSPHSRAHVARSAKKEKKGVGAYDSLSDAFKGYSWKNKLYTENTRILCDLGVQLKSAVGDKDDTSAYITASKIIDWGGVHRCMTGLIQKLDKAQLCKDIEKGATGLTADNDSILQEYGGDQLIMNAGWTKIYAAYNGNSIIYDGRVGAALCVLVRAYLCNKNSNRGDGIPEKLAFTWGAGFGDNRNPNCQGCMNCERGFVKQNPGDSRTWAMKNLYANWILTQVVDKERVKECISRWRNDMGTRREDYLRAIEAALFMLGADVRETVCQKCKKRNKKNAASNDEQEYED
jgi:hypothetical protein